jgi:hypothetical protein
MIRSPMFPQVSLLKRLILGFAFLAMVWGTAGEAKAATILSDTLDVFVGGGTLVARLPFVETSEGQPHPFQLSQPLVIELRDPNTQNVSDVLTITALSGTFTSDSEAALSPTPGAIQVGEIFTALQVLVQSDVNESTTISDTIQIFVAGISLGFAPITENPTTAEETVTFSIGNPLNFDMLEADGTVSDKLVINQFSLGFLSDNESPITHTQGAFQFDETGSLQDLFRLDATSDIPEPASLVIWSLVAGVFGVWQIRKRRWSSVEAT